MAIYDPALFLSENDREILYLLGQLILEAEGRSDSSNRSDDLIPLSHSEAQRLLGLLEDFVSTKRFMESAYFIETLFSDRYDARLVRDLYLKWRKRYGKSRAVATVQWQNFLARLGLISPFLGPDRYWYRASATKMDIDHFLRMEQRLAYAANLSPRVTRIVLDYAQLRSTEVELYRKGEKRLSSGAVAEKPNRIISKLRSERQSRLGIQPIKTKTIAATMTIVMDLATLYTTRDWSVAGVLSVLAGSLPETVLD